MQSINKIKSANYENNLSKVKEVKKPSKKKVIDVINIDKPNSDVNLWQVLIAIIFFIATMSAIVYYMQSQFGPLQHVQCTHVGSSVVCY